MSYPTYDLTFKQYQERSKEFAIYPEAGTGSIQAIMYCALGLCGEAGETAEKIKKLYRDDRGILTDEKRSLLAKECLDQIWYASQLLTELGMSFEEAALDNLKKLQSRKDRNVLSGSGDLR